MRVNILGGGPGGLYAGILIRKRHPGAQVTVYERNRPDDTFGFGVVFSDATLQEIAGADQETYDAITARFYRWDRIHIHYRGEVLDSEGHGFAGLSRRELLLLLHARCEAVGVELRFETEVEDFDELMDADLVIGADGVNSALRKHLAHAFEPQIDLRPNRFVWLGTTRPFPAFTFYFKEDAHGLWRVHAYQYDAQGNSTFIVEARESTWAAAGMDRASEDETVRFLSELFADELAGAPLVRNRSLWRQF
ncbi:MAG: bifunctional salicylyl-CoA 5-hydroxylase/oxidoreductase, partial [Gemmatimonadetes bacterium]|nr:bifunctional salicylyl-CoA 5-hydroxylase/oxidoreductase [Gemmatimonadota bacterium]